MPFFTPPPTAIDFLQNWYQTQRGYHTFLSKEPQNALYLSINFKSFKALHFKT